MGKPIVVCGTDLGASGRRAVALAAACAARLGGRLHVVHAMDIPAFEEEAIPPGIRPAAGTLRARVEEAQRTTEAKLQALAVDVARDVPSKVTVRAGRPWEALVDAASEDGAAMIVVGPHARSTNLFTEIGERLLGTTARRVVRRSPVPVMVATGDVDTAASVLRAQGARLLVGIDFREGGEAALAAAKRFGTKLALVHVLQDVFVPADGPLDWPEIRANWIKELEKRLTTLAGEHADVDSTRVYNGDPAEELALAAEALEAHFLVVGRHAGGTIERMLVGSAAERCLRQARVPVLVVPPQT
ncbi:MAG: universal stress protein [Myxococcota bacterium]